MANGTLRIERCEIRRKAWRVVQVAGFIHILAQRFPAFSCFVGLAATSTYSLFWTHKCPYVSFDDRHRDGIKASAR